MSSAAIQRQYDEVIAANYDLDPQNLTKRTLDLALDHLREAAFLSADRPTFKVLDLGMGTGLFLEKLRNASSRRMRPFGLDVSEKMIEIAQLRIPDLQAVIDDAANVDDAFRGESFDLVCTHFITGFVAIDHLAPRILARLKPGGYWSFVGGTSGAFPGLQRMANSRIVRLMSRGKKFDREQLLTPADLDAVTDAFARYGYETRTAKLFAPELHFEDFEAFLEFGYRGGWLTPFIEKLGLHKSGPMLRKLLTALAFPMHDQHRIAVGLARRPEEGRPEEESP